MMSFLLLGEALSNKCDEMYKGWEIIDSDDFLKCVQRFRQRQKFSFELLFIFKFTYI